MTEGPKVRSSGPLERNRTILNDKRNGVSYAKLSKKHGVSRARIWQICQKEERLRKWQRRFVIRLKNEYRLGQ